VSDKGVFEEKCSELDINIFKNSKSILNVSFLLIFPRKRLQIIESVGFSINTKRGLSLVCLQFTLPLT